MDNFLQPGVLRMLPGRLDRPAVAVVTDNRCQLALQSGMLPLQRFFPQPLPESIIKLLPTEKTKIVPQQPRRRIGGNQARFQRQGPGTAHGIDQGTTIGGDLRPTATGQDCRRQILFQRRMYTIDPVAASMQTVTGKVDAEGRLILDQMQVDTQVGLLHRDRRALPATGAKLVDDGILDA